MAFSASSSSIFRRSCAAWAVCSAWVQVLSVISSLRRLLSMLCNCNSQSTVRQQVVNRIVKQKRHSCLPVWPSLQSVPPADFFQHCRANIKHFGRFVDGMMKKLCQLKDTRPAFPVLAQHLLQHSSMSVSPQCLSNQSLSAHTCSQRSACFLVCICWEPCLSNGNSRAWPGEGCRQVLLL